MTTKDWREMVPTADALPEDVPLPESPNGQPGTDAAARYTPVDWAAAFAAQPEDTAWLVDGFLERGTLSTLFAKPATGKSLLALETTVGLVRDGHGVVYIDQENRLTDLVERLAAFGCQPGDLDPLKLFSFARLPPLDSPAGGADLLALATAHRAALVVIDTATRMLAGHENDADTFTALYRCTLAPLKAQGITVLRLDHPGKDEGRGQRGSSAKDADVDTAWRMTTVAEGREYRLDRTKSRSRARAGRLGAAPPLRAAAARLDPGGRPQRRGRPGHRDTVRAGPGSRASRCWPPDCPRRAEGRRGDRPESPDRGRNPQAQSCPRTVRGQRGQ